MEKLIDFTDCPDGLRDYSGSDHKKSILYNGEHYMLKFPEYRVKENDLQSSHANNVFSEYIGSHVMQSLGISTHETMIGTYDGEPVVACRDFTEILGGKAPYFSTEMKACLQYPISIVEYGIL